MKILKFQEADEKIRLHRDRHDIEKSFKTAPPDTSEVLSGVNLFSVEQVDPQDPLGPFICHESLKFSDQELKLLARGPKFMVRTEMSREDFDVEVKKMVAKQKLDGAFNKEEH